jgi:hypothetical protein
MQEAVGIRVNLLMTLNTISVEAHAVGCLYKDLYEWWE